jgi:PKD repeat protein
VISGVVAEDAVSSTPYQVTVTADDGNGQTVSQNFEWIVNDSQVAVQVSPVSVEEGAGFVLQAGFTDTDVVDRHASDYTVVVNWGDGCSDTLDSLGAGSNDAPITGSAGQFSISDGYAYSDPGNYAIQVTVTDLAGESWVGTTMATVSAAPLTMTGGLVDDAVPGVSVTQTLASFTDANAADGASSYVATVNWGDGTQTSGVISGSEGDFVVSGTHAYAAQGNYQVTVTVSNAADQTTGSATSTVDVGAIYAGQAATLQVASFTSSNPNAAASNFNATITWGDGTQSAGVVTGSNGQFQVTGTHTYAADGSYAVQVTVADQYGDTLNATGSVSVVRDPLGGYGNTMEATAGVALNNVLVGVLTDPDAGDQSGAYMALINWGDGTAPTMGTVIGSNGLFEVLGSHTYVTPGEYVPSVHVEWDGSRVLVSLVGLMAVGLAPGAEAPQPIGPNAVPGNSVYNYTFALPADVTEESVKDLKPWSVTGDTGVLISQRQWFTPDPNNKDNVIATTLQLAFQNKPGVVEVHLNLNVKDKIKANIDMSVNVVKVVVGRPRFPIGTNDPSGFDKGAAPSGTQVVGPIPVQGVEGNTKGMNVSAGFSWDAGVTLYGPGFKDDNRGGGAGVNQIHVGFYQYAKLEIGRVNIENKTQKKFYWLVFTMTVNPKKYRDVQVRQRGPWFDSIAEANLFGSPDKSFADIVSSDTPQIAFPIAPFPGDQALRGLYTSEFTLDVAASTNAIRNSPIWAEANASKGSDPVATPQTSWVLNLDGGIKWDAKGENATWVPSKSAGVLPMPKNWVSVSKPVMEDQGGLTANEAAKQSRWVP